MNSRMDRYKQIDNEQENVSYARSNKNKKLYDNLDYDVFSSNETVIDTSNEIDITKLKQMINSREDYKKSASYRNILEDKNDYNYDYIKEHNTKQEYEEKNYDINELLTKVKSEKKDNEEERTRKLVNTQYDILSKLDVKGNTEPLEKSNDRLDELINTITLKKKEEEFDLFDDLKGENTIVTDGFKDEENKTLPAYEEDINEKEVEENNFLDDSVVFNTQDFESLDDEDDEKKGNVFVKILIFVLMVVVITVAIFVLDSMYHFIPF